MTVCLGLLLRPLYEIIQILFLRLDDFKKGEVSNRGMKYIQYKV